MKHPKNVYLVCLDGSDGSKECLHQLARLLCDHDEVALMTIVKNHDGPEAKAKAGNMFVFYFFFSFYFSFSCFSFSFFFLFFFSLFFFSVSFSCFV